MGKKSLRRPKHSMNEVVEPEQEEEEGGGVVVVVVVVVVVPLILNV
jgi:hypothetical protein